MPQTRLAFEAAELLHLELECPSCHAVTAFPIGSLNPDRFQQTGQFALSNCPWCNDEAVKQYEPVVLRTITTLASLRADTSLRLRFIFQGHFRDSE
ncbi:MAG: hypothetical protein AB7P69_17870 [Candidatus Binatia bacterium]